MVPVSHQEPGHVQEDDPLVKSQELQAEAVLLGLRYGASRASRQGSLQAACRGGSIIPQVQSQRQVPCPAQSWALLETSHGAIPVAFLASPHLHSSAGVAEQLGHPPEPPPAEARVPLTLLLTLKSGFGIFYLGVDLVSGTLKSCDWSSYRDHLVCWCLLGVRSEGRPYLKSPIKIFLSQVVVIWTWGQGHLQQGCGFESPLTWKSIFWDKVSFPSYCSWRCQTCLSAGDIPVLPDSMMSGGHVPRS